MGGSDAIPVAPPATDRRARKLLWPRALAFAEAEGQYAELRILKEAGLR
jgi:hypothetical protein